MKIPTMIARILDKFTPRRVITVADFLEALEKNGYPWIKGSMYQKGASCAMGQATRNLWPELKSGVEIDLQAYRLESALNRIGKDRVGLRIVRANDRAATYQAVVIFAKDILAGKENVVIDIL